MGVRVGRRAHYLKTAEKDIWLVRKMMCILLGYSGVDSALHIRHDIWGSRVAGKRVIVQTASQNVSNPDVAVRDYLQPGHGHHTVVGTLKVIERVYSPQLENTRDLLVYLPPSYMHGLRRYPVLYMHDGQNLFDEVTSFTGEWRVDETLQELSREGLEAIVVGVPNMGPERLNEYSPFVDTRHGGGQGDAYVQFLAETVKPLIDSLFRTQPDRETTGIMGSSMGGLISLYAFFRRPETFGFAGVMSPSFWFADRAIFPYIKKTLFAAGRIYLDMGTDEYPFIRPGLRRRVKARFKSRRYLADTRHLYGTLLQKGYRPKEDVLYLEEKGARHEEAAWARRLPAALRFLLRDTAP